MAHGEERRGVGSNGRQVLAHGIYAFTETDVAHGKERREAGTGAWHPCFRETVMSHTIIEEN